MKSAEESAQEAKRGDEDGKPSAGRIGGLIVAGFTSLAAQKKTDGNEDKPRATFMTTTNEVLKVTTAVGATDVAIPAGFKENK